MKCQVCKVTGANMKRCKKLLSSIHYGENYDKRTGFGEEEKVKAWKI